MMSGTRPNQTIAQRRIQGTIVITRDLHDARYLTYKTIAQGKIQCAIGISRDHHDVRYQT